VSYGQDLVKRQIAQVLTSVFPGIEDVDMQVVAAKIIDSVDMVAVKTINSGESRFHKALSSVMELNTGLIDGLRKRVDELEAERAELHLKLARYQQSASLPQETPTEGDA
jgi:ribosomal protein L29